NGYQLGSGNCRKTDGRMVAVPREQCVAMDGTVELPLKAEDVRSTGLNRQNEAGLCSGPIVMKRMPGGGMPPSSERPPSHALPSVQDSSGRLGLTSWWPRSASHEVHHLFEGDSPVLVHVDRP